MPLVRPLSSSRRTCAIRCPKMVSNRAYPVQTRLQVGVRRVTVRRRQRQSSRGGHPDCAGQYGRHGRSRTLKTRTAISLKYFHRQRSQANAETDCIEEVLRLCRRQLGRSAGDAPCVTNEPNERPTTTCQVAPYFRSSSCAGQPAQAAALTHLFDAGRDVLLDLIALERVVADLDDLGLHVVGHVHRLDGRRRVLSKASALRCRTGRAGSQRGSFERPYEAAHGAVKPARRRAAADRSCAGEVLEPGSSTAPHASPAPRVGRARSPAQRQPQSPMRRRAPWSRPSSRPFWRSRVSHDVAGALRTRKRVESLAQGRAATGSQRYGASGAAQGGLAEYQRLAQEPIRPTYAQTHWR